MQETTTGPTQTEPQPQPQPQPQTPPQTPPPPSQGSQGNTQAPQSPQPQKKSGAWKWVLIGCLTIIIVGALAVGGCVWYTSKKAQEVGKEFEKTFNSEEIQKELNKLEEYNYSELNYD